jgi:hypothetical protein
VRDRRMRAFVLGGLVVLMPSLATARQSSAEPSAQGEGSDLAKKLSYPISDLVSIPFQLNWEQNVGPAEQTRFILNLQPVMPFVVNTRWNMIASSSYRLSASRRSSQAAPRPSASACWRRSSSPPRSRARSRGVWDP